MSEANAFVCTTCCRSYPLHTREWKCGCGGLLDFEYRPPFDPGLLDPLLTGVWRYRHLLPLDPAWEPVSLGEGNTPLLPVQWASHLFHFKNESLAPSGSFKDRGTTVLATALRGLGIPRVVEDSSGNAGASLAAYAARAGIACDICVPNTAGGPKVAQMAAHGAEVIEIKGRREYAALAAWAAAAHGAYYASHVYNPFFLAGIETLAYELWEQLGRQGAAALVVPVGNGTLLLGLYEGFKRLLQAGLVDRLPRLFAVQATACAPLYHAFRQGQTQVSAVDNEPSVATGIAIAQPARGEEILAAVRTTDGAVLGVPEQSIVEARRELARKGFYVEETAAAAAAALAEVVKLLPSSAAEPYVVVLTGHGLKSRPQPRDTRSH